MDRKRLKNPPISQVIVAVQLTDIFTSKDDIDTFYNNSYLRKQYPKKEEIKSVVFELSDTPKVSDNVTEIYDLTNESNTEQIQIGQGKIIFVDRNKYTKFDTFINKFIKILDEVKKAYKDKEIIINSIGLRYVNNFNLPLEICKNNFMISLNININDNETNNYARIKNYMSMINVNSSEHENIFANIKTLFKLDSKNLINIVFDIDTIAINTQKSKFKDIIIQLKNFENDIFFNNFKNIYEIKEFN